MAGTKRGPMAKPDDVRERRNAPAVEQTAIGPDELPSWVDVTPEPPSAVEGWHPIVKEAWDALKTDPARLTMTSGDWMATKIVFESMSRALMPQVVGVIQNNEHGPGDVIRDRVPVNGAQMTAFLTHLTRIGLTEGARRAIGMHVKLGVNTDALQTGERPRTVKSRADLFVVREEEEGA